MVERSERNSNVTPRIRLEIELTMRSGRESFGILTINP